MRQGTRLSERVKDELVRAPPGHACCEGCELEVLVLARVRPGHDRLVFRGTNLTRRIYELSRHVAGAELVREASSGSGEGTGRRTHRVRLGGTLRELVPPDRASFDRAWKSSFAAARRRRCCRLAFLRGLFLAGGSISVTRETFHLEIVLPDGLDRSRMEKMVEPDPAGFLFFSRRGRDVMYLKSGETVSEFLGRMGAVSTMLLLEDVKISRKLHESVNRCVNMEISNLRRSSHSARLEVEAIEFLKDRGLLDRLPEKLRETAQLRMCHPTADLKELAGLAPDSLTKSGIYHRLRALRHRALAARPRDPSPDDDDRSEGP